VNRKHTLLPLDRALVRELIHALGEAQTLAMAVDRTPVGDRYLQRACDLAEQLGQHLATADPSDGVHHGAPDSNRAMPIDVAEIVERTLSHAISDKRPYDRIRARDMAWAIARTCNDLPQRRSARDRALANDARLAAIIGARDRALNRGRDLALAFAENLHQPWRPAHLLGLLARLLPPAERQLFLEEHYASLAHASRVERWVYLLDLLPTLPMIVWVLRRATWSRSTGDPLDDVERSEVQGGPDAPILPSSASADGHHSMQLGPEPWSMPFRLTGPTPPTRPLTQGGLPQGA
jgi:hypothetical protein